ncbi:hypothetical protein KKG22_02485 [Patescibacteria group bacterium]|nr:hypothetical protein [Patescibacteria group bacterium]MBU1722169.1 hypothetical protein [Patescibacteria group bacterium]MBU1901120.1 hypothetical protein [Patescibacteria group bacterium]
MDQKTTSQPSILVKKKDGTSVRMTLAELRASGSTKVAPDKSSSTKVVPSKPVVQNTKVTSSHKPAVVQVKDNNNEIKDLASLPVKKKRRRRRKNKVTTQTTVPVAKKIEEQKEKIPYIDADMLPGAVDNSDDIVFVLDKQKKVEDKTPIPVDDADDGEILFDLSDLPDIDPVVDNDDDRLFDLSDLPDFDEEEDDFKVTDEMFGIVPEAKELMVEAAHELATTTPVAHAFVNEAEAMVKEKVQFDDLGVRVPKKEEKKQVEWGNEDYSSLLEEDDSLEEGGGVSSLDEELVQKKMHMIAAVKGSIPQELEDRFAALAVSFLKGIRTRREVLNYLLQAVDQGGLGLDATVAAKIMEEMHQVSTQEVDELPAIDSAKEVPKEVVAPKPNIIPEEPARDIPYTVPIAPQRPSMPQKPLVQDVVAPNYTRKAVGPVEELAGYTLEEFRRLSDHADAQVSKIVEKMQRLQKESYILFLDAQDAWRSSPLFRLYQDVVADAIRQQLPIVQILAQYQQLSQEEFDAIVRINRTVLG